MRFFRLLPVFCCGSVFILWSFLSWLLAFFQVRSLSKDDNRLAEWGGCGQVAEHAGTSISEQGWDRGLLCYLPNALLLCSPCGHTNSLLFTWVKQAIPAQSSPCQRSMPHLHEAIRWMTGEVIKTGTTSLLSLSLNMNHAANLDMWMCRHIWFSGEEAFACCLTLWVSLSGRNHWNADRGVWIMDCPTVAQRSTHSTIPSDSHSCCSLHYTSPFFNPREVLARGQPSLSVWVTEYVRVCLCLCFCVGM